MTSSEIFAMEFEGGSHVGGFKSHFIIVMPTKPVRNALEYSTESPRGATVVGAMEPLPVPDRGASVLNSYALHKH